MDPPLWGQSCAQADTACFSYGEKGRADAGGKMRRRVKDPPSGYLNEGPPLRACRGQASSILPAGRGNYDVAPSARPAYVGRKACNDALSDREAGASHLHSGRGFRCPRSHFFDKGFVPGDTRVDVDFPTHSGHHREPQP